MRRGERVPPAVLPLTKADAEKYAGQWVAVKGDRVVLAAPTADELLRRIQAEDVAPDLVLRAPAPNEPQTWIF